MLKCIIMAGGTGTRLWPLSRKNKPKQFQPLVSDKTMLQETFLRLRTIANIEDIYVSTNSEYVSEVEREILELPRKNILGEPEARGTASSVALASALIAEESGEDAIVGVFPADHFIREDTVFISAIERAQEFLKDHPDFIVTLGIIPGYPETGYGYIQQGKVLAKGGKLDVMAVERFVEKPDVQTAEKYLAEGGYLWNTAIYIFRVGAMLEKIGKYIPDTYKRAERIRRSKEEERAAVIKVEYPQMDKINTEYSIIENDPWVAVIPVNLGWSDVGSWTALKDVLTTDEKGHFVRGDHIDFNSENLLVYGSKKLVVTVGVKDLIVIDTDDAILICDRRHAQRMSEVVKKLEESNHKVI